jgi:hypothetical protein
MRIFFFLDNEMSSSASAFLGEMLEGRKAEVKFKFGGL